MAKPEILLVPLYYPMSPLFQNSLPPLSISAETLLKLLLLHQQIQKRDEMQRFMHYMAKTRSEAEAEEGRCEELINKEVEEKWKQKGRPK